MGNEEGKCYPSVGDGEGFAPRVDVVGGAGGPQISPSLPAVEALTTYADAYVDYKRVNFLAKQALLLEEHRAFLRNPSACGPMKGVTEVAYMKTLSEELMAYMAVLKRATGMFKARLAEDFPRERGQLPHLEKYPSLRQAVQDNFELLLGLSFEKKVEPDGSVLGGVYSFKGLNPVCYNALADELHVISGGEECGGFARLMGQIRARVAKATGG